VHARPFTALVTGAFVPVAVLLVWLHFKGVK
jgi:hypothetical protein